MKHIPVNIPMARPGWSIPIAKPVETPVFPHIAMPRRNAIVDVVVLFFLFYGFQVGLGISGLPLFLIEQFPGFGIFGVNVVIGLFTLALVAGCLHIRNQRACVIGLNRPTPLRFWIAAPLGLPLCYAASIVGVSVYMGIFSPTMEEITEDKLALFDLVDGFPVALILPFTLFVGIHEEIFFRGFLLSRMRAIFRSDILAIIISGILFGLAHGYQDWLGVFQTGAIGMALAALATYSRTLWPAIIAHAAFNAINLLIMPLLRGFLEDSLREMGIDPNAMVILSGAIGVGS